MKTSVSIAFLICLCLATSAVSAQQVATLPSALPDTSVAHTSFDYRVLKTLQDSRTEGWNRHWVAVSNSFVLAPLSPLGFAVGGALTPDDPQRRRLLYANAMESCGAYMLCMGVTMGLKAVVGRPRPWVTYEGDLVCLQPVRSASFPSGHTSSVFVTATSLSLVCPRWYVAVPAYLWAGSVAFSRLYVGAHYPTDVLTGAAIGTGCALLAHWVRQRLCQEHPELYPPEVVMLPVAFSF